MKHILLLGIGILMVPTLLKGQTGGINISFTPQYYLNELNLDVARNAAKYASITTQNTGGYCVGVAYERTFKKRFSVLAGIKAGNERDEIDFAYNFSNYDVDAKETLNGLIYRQSFKANQNYFAPHILIGYNQPITQRMALSVKFGATLKIYTTGTEGQGARNITYIIDDSTENRESTFLAYGMTIGNNHDLWKKGIRYSIKAFCFDAVIGAEYKIKMPLIKYISAGVEFNRLRIPDNGMLLMLATKDYWSGATQDNNYYRLKNYSIGLRLAIGLGQ